MSANDRTPDNDSLSEPAARALLAFLRHKEESGRDDVHAFLQASPQFADYANIIQSYADAANEAGFPEDPLLTGEDISTDDGRCQSQNETMSFLPASKHKSRRGLPVEVVYETVIRDIAMHAEGGLGVVCRAEDTTLRREVAVKFIKPDQLSESSREIFELEAEVTGRLDHPCVTPVHGVGETEDGRRFYVMRFLPGESLRDQIDRYHQHKEQDESERAVDFRNMLASFVSVCKTVGYAHSRGILHRDVKPQNIMLGRYGETTVVDWGLALPIRPSHEHRVQGDQTIIPVSGGSSASYSVAAGTLAYMPPEQALGENELTPQADIYALGATLYHLLCGRPPLKRSRERTNDIQAIVRGEFPRPRELQGDASPDLEAICLKAMESKAEDRYATALELAEDVERFIADEPVSVHPDNVAQRVTRWTRHHPVAFQVAALSMTMVLLSVTLGAIVSWYWYAQAVDSKEKTLLQSAGMAAERWATDLSLRWMLLEQWADDPVLHSELQSLSIKDNLQEADCLRLEDWLVNRVDERADYVSATSWYVNDKQGRLLARSPGKSEHQLERFDYRSYFHGGPDDLGQKKPGENPYPMLSQPTLSAIYRSVGENDAYRVALSVPIVDVEERKLGVLTMTIDLGYLKDADLIDMRRNTFGGKHSLEGVYLKHKSLGGPETLKQVSGKLLQAINQAFSGTDTSSPMLVREYSRPLDPEGAPTCKAAIAPIQVHGENTGLVVVVEEGKSAK